MTINKRAAIYFFYDKNGIVDKYVEYFLADFSKYCDYILIVCNGKLNDEGHSCLSKYGEVLVRDNVGFDVWAYKTGIEHIGWENIRKYDEVIFLNSTIMGPIDSFEDTFKKSEQMDVDFWGITAFYKVGSDPFNCIKYGYIPTHIQSHWIAVRNRMLNSDELYQYWTNMPMITCYEEAVGKHEAIFTKTFSDMGYTWGLTIERDGLEEFTFYPLMMCPTHLLKDLNCPIFKRRSFFHSKTDLLAQTAGEASSELFDYLDSQTSYDVDMIWETILRNYNQYDIQQALNITKILPKDYVIEEPKTDSVAICMHIYFVDILDETYKYISNIPESYPIFITTDTEDKKNYIIQYLNKHGVSNFEVRLIQNRGRDVSSLLVGLKDVVSRFEYICFVHDKKTAQINPAIKGNSFAYKCFENCLGSESYIKNVVHSFEINPRMGMLSPTAPNANHFYATIGAEWGENFSITKKLANKLNITVDINEEKPPITPLGTMFWFRSAAFKSLLDYGWEYSDFPQEPNKIDGSILHAFERIYSFVVQENGFYPGFVLTDSYASMELCNQYVYLEGFNKVLFKRKLFDSYVGIIENLDDMLNRLDVHDRRRASWSFKILCWPYILLRKIKIALTKSNNKK